MPNFAHQEETYLATRDLQNYAIFWEQGTGKTKLALDTAAYLHAQGKIDAVLVLAPNGVQRNWIEDELPKWLPSANGAFHTTQRMGTKGGRAAIVAACDGPFPVLAMSYDGIMTKAGAELAARVLKTRRTLFICDESTAIKNAGAKRTKRVLAAGKYAAYRRIMNGTPIPNSPFDLYSQIRFLDDDFWKRLGYANSAVFKEYFGKWETGKLKEPMVTKSGKVITEFRFVSHFRNLQQLHDHIDPISHRVLKADVLDLPDKLYTKRYFDLSPEQRKVYKEIKDEALTFLATGEMLTAPLAIVRMLRLQQVTCNYLPTETGDYLDLAPNNPRLRCLETLLEEVTHGCIIWARFRRDIDLICEMLGDKCVRYDGAVKDDARAQAKQRFQSGGAQFFVGNPAAAGMGLTLTAARTVVYYNNDFRLATRLQSEDRAHRIGQEHPVEYVDIMAPNTIDGHIVRALRNKVNIASVVTGDNLKEWI